VSLSTFIVRKKAVELARRGQKDLDTGMSLSTIITKLQDQGKKRDSAAKLAEVIEILNEDQGTKPKKLKISDRPSGAEVTATSTKKNKRVKKCTDHPTSSNEHKTKNLIHPQKMAEITELLGESSDIILLSKTVDTASATEKKSATLPSSPSSRASISISPKRNTKEANATVIYTIITCVATKA
jgi:hypothetical protein